MCQDCSYTRAWLACRTRCQSDAFSGVGKGNPPMHVRRQIISILSCLLGLATIYAALTAKAGHPGFNTFLPFAGKGTDLNLPTPNITATPTNSSTPTRTPTATPTPAGQCGERRLSASGSAAWRALSRAMDREVALASTRAAPSCPDVTASTAARMRNPQTESRAAAGARV